MFEVLKCARYLLALRLPQYTFLKGFKKMRQGSDGNVLATPCPDENGSFTTEVLTDATLRAAQAAFKAHQDSNRRECAEQFRHDTPYAFDIKIDRSLVPSGSPVQDFRFLYFGNGQGGIQLDKSSGVSGGSGRVTCYYAVNITSAGNDIAFNYSGKLRAAKYISDGSTEDPSTEREITRIVNGGNGMIVNWGPYNMADTKAIIDMPFFNPKKGYMDVLDYLQDDRIHSTQERCAVARLMVKELSWLHKLGFLHRDAKPENFMINPAKGIREDGMFKGRIIDFGFGVRAEDAAAMPCGTLGYMAPEVLLGRKHSTASDVFSLGVSLFTLYAQGSEYEAALQNYNSELNNWYITLHSPSNVAEQHENENEKVKDKTWLEQMITIVNLTFPDKVREMSGVELDCPENRLIRELIIKMLQSKPDERCNLDYVSEQLAAIAGVAASSAPEVNINIPDEEPAVEMLVSESANRPGQASPASAESGAAASLPVGFGAGLFGAGAAQSGPPVADRYIRRSFSACG